MCKVYGAMPRSRDPGYVRVPDTIQPYSIIAAGATSPEPSEARKAAMLWLYYPLALVSDLFDG